MSKSVVLSGVYILNQRNPLQYFKNHKQGPIILISLSFFDSLYHHFKVHIVDILFVQSFSGVRGQGIKKRHVYLGIYGLKQGNILQNSTNHSQRPNILFYYQFFVHFLIISRFTEFLLDSFMFLWSKR